MERLLNVTAVLSGGLLAAVLVSLRRAHIRVEYSVSWLVAAAALLALSRCRPVLAATARNLGITYTPLALLLLAGAIFLIMFYRFSMIVSRLKDDNIALAQRVAILEFHIDSLRKQEQGGTAA